MQLTPSVFSVVLTVFSVFLSVFVFFLRNFAIFQVFFARFHKKTLRKLRNCARKTLKPLPLRASLGETKNKESQGQEVSIKILGVHCSKAAGGSTGGAGGDALDGVEGAESMVLVPAPPEYIPEILL